MPSIIEGYNYDIFISYRQKDNKGDMWVSEFVETLKTELESTFKEEISVYFDINPHDGLLESHEVGDSLKEKLRCLIFIPVISRTYCDPKSFAWEHEFKAFVDQASKDQFGLKVKLPGGNVASRVLPVRIYDLNKEDIQLCESVLGGVLRGIEFIYKSAGVNRPLRANEDHAQDNLNKTYYRDQINKMSHSIQEIIQGLRTGSAVSPAEKISYKESPSEIQKEKIKPVRENPIKLPWKKIITGVIAVAVLVTMILVFSKILMKNKYTDLNSTEVLQKAISVCDYAGNWDVLSIKIRLIHIRLDGKIYCDEIIELDNKKDYYQSNAVFSDKSRIIKGTRDGKYYRVINGDNDPSEELIKKHELYDEDIQFIKEHHKCIIGLLMELNESGLTLEKKVESVKFRGDECLRLNFVRDTLNTKNNFLRGIQFSVYIDPMNYSMKGYDMFTAEKVGFSMVLTGNNLINDINIPMCQMYYNMANDSFTGLDVITKVE